MDTAEDLTAQRWMNRRDCAVDSDLTHLAEWPWWDQPALKAFDPCSSA
jgi:hypothetical protein